MNINNFTFIPIEGLKGKTVHKAAYYDGRLVILFTDDTMFCITSEIEYEYGDPELNSTILEGKNCEAKIFNHVCEPFMKLGLIKHLDLELYHKKQREAHDKEKEIEAKELYLRLKERFEG